MANASVICTDKTSMLTQNVMSVVTGSISIHAKFVYCLEQNQSRMNVADDHRTSHLNMVLSPWLQKLFNTAIAVNSTAFEDKDWESGRMVFEGNKTETALLSFAKEQDEPIIGTSVKRPTWFR
ncbi:hypothetical protein EDC04DRAFT_2865078 [Pisolithus marmoratus]|nr:hypothetical protein EDC04DRAFT_2865078 [Pisolithus marmoratus]